MALKFPKHKYVRSKKLLEAARQIPCQLCGADDGTVVAAHKNWGGGKGMGIKASDDLIASLCYSCHMMIDQGKDLSKEDRKDKWHIAHVSTYLRLKERGLWPDDIPKPY